MAFSILPKRNKVAVSFSTMGITGFADVTNIAVGASVLVCRTTEMFTRYTVNGAIQVDCDTESH